MVRSDYLDQRPLHQQIYCCDGDNQSGQIIWLISQAQWYDAWQKDQIQTFSQTTIRGKENVQTWN